MMMMAIVMIMLWKTMTMMMMDADDVGDNDVVDGNHDGEWMLMMMTMMMDGCC